MSFTILLWIPGVAALFTVGFGYYRYRTFLFDTARSLQNERLFVHKRAAVPIERLPEAPSEISPKIVLGVDELVSYTQTLAPDWILGIHTGGRILSVHVAHRLGFPHNRCLYGRLTASSLAVSGIPRVDGNNVISGKLLVIDDICRTGSTFEVLKSVLISANYRSYYRLSKVYFAALVVVVPSEGYRPRLLPDWAWARTSNFFYKFPWSDFSARISTAYVNMKQARAFDATVIAENERIASDYEFALGIAEGYLRNVRHHADVGAG